jgi:hypothetical protein
MKRNLAALFLIVALEQAQATTFVLDTFTTGPFALSESGSFSDSDRINSPLGNNRDVRINRGLAAPGTTMTTTLDTGSGTVSLNFNGQSLSVNNPLDFRAVYSIGGPFSLLGSTAFELDFSELSGSGFLITELGGVIASSHGPSTSRIALNGPGTVVVPFSELNFSPSGSIDDFSSTLFVFEADSQAFAFTLDEIRVVPEPSSVLLVGLGGLGGLVGLTRRKRVAQVADLTP